MIMTKKLEIEQKFGLEDLVEYEVRQKQYIDASKYLGMDTTKIVEIDGNFINEFDKEINKHLTPHEKTWMSNGRHQLDRLLILRHLRMKERDIHERFEVTVNGGDLYGPCQTLEYDSFSKLNALNTDYISVQDSRAALFEESLNPIRDLREHYNILFKGGFRKISDETRRFLVETHTEESRKLVDMILRFDYDEDNENEVDRDKICVYCEMYERGYKLDDIERAYNLYQNNPQKINIDTFEKLYMEPMIAKGLSL